MDVVLVENFVKHALPRLADALAACLVGLIRVKYVFGAEEEGMRAEDEAAGARGRLRHELRGMESGRTGRFLGGIVQAWYMASPVEAEEAIDATFQAMNRCAKGSVVAFEYWLKQSDQMKDFHGNGTGKPLTPVQVRRHAARAATRA